MKGKDKCKILKEIRAQIAAANDIAWVTENCTHKGDCRGTCPKCEAEVRELERALARRRALGKTVAVVGLSAGIIATTAACDALSMVEGNQLSGDATTTTTVSTDNFVQTGDIGGAIVLPKTLEADGEMVLHYYTADFTPCESVAYVADRLMHVEHLQDFDYVGETVWEIPEGAEFSVIGVGRESGMLLVEYDGQQYVLWESDIYPSVTEVVPDTAEPADPA